MDSLANDNALGAIKDTKNLEGFLSKVDEISDIIANLNSDNDQVRAKAMAESDKVVAKLEKKKMDNTGVNRTLINKDAYKKPATGPSQPPTDQEAFMKALEKDATERSERKRKAKAEATVLKEQGNKVFKAGDYIKAVELYSQALEKIKDFKELWTNRAQAYIKLSKYKEALTDCDWAQRCDETFTKAYVLEAKAHLSEKYYDKAIDAYKRGIEANKEKERLLNEYIRDVEIQRETEGKNEAALRQFESGSQHANTLVDVMKRVQQLDELPLFYDGGVRILADIIVNDEHKSLFRAEGGLNLFNSHPFYHRVMQKASLESLNKEEHDACVGLLLLLQKATENNDESIRELISTENFPSVILRLLNPRALKRKPHLRLEALNLLRSLASREVGLKRIAQNIPPLELLATLYKLFNQGGEITLIVCTVITNLLEDDRIRKAFYSTITDFIASNIRLIKNDNHQEVVPPCLTMLTRLCSDTTIRKYLSLSPDLIKAAANYLESFPSSLLSQHRAYFVSVHAALGLLVNITIDKTESVKSCALMLTKAVLPYLDQPEDVQMRSLGVLSHVINLDPEAVQLYLAQTSRVALLLDLLESDRSYTKYMIKVLTSLTQISEDTCRAVVRHRHALSRLTNIINSSADESLVGNATLCLSHCVAREDAAASSINMDCMKRLLVLTREANAPLVKQNCAILVGKLATKSQRHLEWLRELDGIGILHNSTKYYQL